MEKTAFYEQLVERYYSNKVSEAELEVFYALVEKGELDDYLRSAMNLRAGITVEDEERAGALALRDGAKAVVRRGDFWQKAWIRYAAVLVMFVGFGVAVWLKSQRSPAVMTGGGEQAAGKDILPGGNKAVLTLADGSTIILDSAANGALANQGNVQVLKLDAGKLAYKGNGSEAMYNSISTPKGGQYQIELPDGSRVWLNAASSIRFPTTFGKERNVRVTGEVYLEIAADKKRPFTVKAGETQIDVLGTRFNVNAYADEPAVKVTLEGGKIKIGQTELNPGQQAVVAKTITVNTGPNMEQVTAWKKGLFDFNDITVEAALRQLGKWYDVEVSCSPSLANKFFGGKMSRDLTLNQVVKLLNGPDMHFELSGRHLSVTP